MPYYKDNPETKRKANATRRTVNGKRIYPAHPDHPDHTPRPPKVYNPASYAAPYRSATSMVRPGGYAFRKALLDATGHCKLTGCPYHSLIEAAHIKPVKLCDPDEYYDLDNGMLLRADLHKAFDRGMWTVDENGWVTPCDTFKIERVARTIRWRPSWTSGQLRRLAGHREWAITQFTYSQLEKGSKDDGRNTDLRHRSGRIAPCCHQSVDHLDNEGWSTR